jgi:transcriptional regulator with XRE-family HTH domain
MEHKLQSCVLTQNHKAFLLLQELGFSPARIRRALHKLTGISQRYVAKQLDMRRVSVTRYISGRRKDWASMAAIAEIFDIPVEVMFSDVAADRDTT